MKRTAYLLASLALTWALTSCATTTTVTEYPDGHKVTVTEKGIDPAAPALAGTAVRAYAVVRGDK